MKRWRYSLRGQIWLMLMVATVAFAVSFGVIFYHALSNEGQRRLAAEHQQIVEDPEAITWLGKEDTAHFLVADDELSWQSFKRNAQVPGRHGRERMYRTIMAEMALDKSMQSFTLMDRKGYYWLISYLPESDQYLISAFYPAVREVVAPIVALTLLVVLLGVAHALMVSRCVIRPIHQLAEYAGHIAARRWQPPLASRASAREVAELIEAMNDMQRLLRQSDEEQQAFLQSISHDLKTPVAVIVAHAQAIMDGVYVGSAENNACVIQAEALRLQEKIQKILYYNTLDYSLADDTGWQLVEVPALLHELADRFAALAPHLHWQVDAEPGWVRADEENLRVALENILDNALRYASTQISLSCTCSAGYVVITIFNDGEAIEAARLESIFDQLSKGKKGNFGLGLFISRKIISCLGGQIAARNAADGVRFVITLPKAER